MARSWSHFTSYLSAGDIITQAQRNELIDTVVAVFDDIDGDASLGSWSILSGDQTAIQASPIITDLMGVAGGTDDPTPLCNILYGLSAFYAHPTSTGPDWDPDAFDIFDFTGHGSGPPYHLFADAADEISLSHGAAEALIESNYAADGVRAMDHRWWNLMRAACNVLDTPYDF